MAEETYRTSPEVYTTAKGENIILRSVGDNQLSTAQYDDIMTVYNKTGQLPPNVKPIPAGGITEKIYNVIDYVTPKAGQQKLTASPYFATQKLTGETLPTAEQAGKSLVPQDTGQLLTEGVLTALGASKLKNVSGIVPPLVRMAGAALGNVAGQYAEGETDLKQLSQHALKTASLAAAGEAGTGIVKWFLGTGISQAAKDQVQNDLGDLIKKEHRNLGFVASDELSAILSTKRGAQEFSIIGIKALRRTTQEMSDEFVNDVNTMMQRPLGKVAEKKLRVGLEKYVELSNKLYDNIDDTKLADEIKEETGKLFKSISAVVANEFKKGGAADAVAALKVQGILNGYAERDTLLKSHAEVLGALRRSGAKEGFEVVPFQEELNKISLRSSGLMEKVALAAGRGRLGGVDQPLFNPFKEYADLARGAGALTGLPIGQRVGAALNRLGNLSGTHFTGTIRSPGNVYSAPIVDMGALRTLGGYDEPKPSTQP
jgi:hypothetical protein